MAWDGIDSTTLADNRRYNPAGHYIDDNGNDAFMTTKPTITVKIIFNCTLHIFLTHVGT